MNKEKRNLEIDFNDCLNRIIKIANEKYDGHFTLMSFTTHFKACFGTINGREHIKSLKPHKTIDDAVFYLLEQDSGFHGIKGIDYEYYDEDLKMPSMHELFGMN